ncbi:MAG: tetratricopeptide repeat protein [Pseudomonadota bacterium]|nr:tetratricopeptide repeat protein [Pseudomonadota bacterium]
MAQPVARSKPPPPVTRPNPVPRPNSVPVAPGAKEAVPQYRGTPPRGLPGSGAKPTDPRAATSAPKGPVPVKPKELTVRERQYLAYASRLDQEAGELWWQRRYVDVEYRYREALRYREAVFGQTHPDVAHSLIRLARLYWGSYRNQEAAALHRRALYILEHRLGAESVELANAFWEYGGLLQLRGDYAGAEPLMAKALNVLETDLDSQRNISWRRTTYATVLSELGRSEEAARILRR